MVDAGLADWLPLVDAPLFRDRAGRAEARTDRQPPGSYPSLQWDAGPTPDARPDPMTVAVQLPSDSTTK